MKLATVRKGRGKTPGRLRLGIALSLLAAFSLAPPPEASGAKFTLLGLSRIRQSALLSYDYQDSVNDYGDSKSSSTQQGFSEGYGISFEYSILHPRLLNGEADLSLVADQELSRDSDEGNSSSGNNRISYRVKGTLLDRKPNPLIFNLNSDAITVRPPFSSTYTIDARAHSVSWSIRNHILPASLMVSSNSSTTSGLPFDTRNESQTIQVTAEHRSAELSDSKLSLTKGAHRRTFLDAGVRDDTDEARLDFANTLAWSDPRGLNRRVDTRYLYFDRSGSNAGGQRSLASTLSWDVGKALDARVAYNLNRNDDLNGKSNTQTVGGSLTHQFVRALNTHLGVVAARGRYNDGSDDSLGWNLGGRYTKLLPYEGGMTLSYDCSKVVQDRSRSLVTLGAFTSVAVAAPYPLDTDLVQENINPSSIRIHLDEGRTLPFTDFTVLFSGALTRVRINSDPGVSQLYLSYSYLQSPDIKFQTVSQHLGSQFSFLSSRHVLQVNYGWTERRLLEGTDPSSSLEDTSSFNAKLQSRLSTHELSLEYSNQKGESQDLQTVEGAWSHFTPGSGGALRTEARDRYSLFSGRGTRGGDDWDNTLQLTATYSRLLPKNFRGTLTLGYYNLATADTSSHRVSTSFGVDGSYGRTTISLQGAFGLTLAPSGGHSQNQSLTLNVRRMF